MTTAEHDGPFDVGLQAERTLLAWRRTSLALAVGNAIGIRYLWDTLGLAAAFIGIVGLAVAAATWIIISIRYRRFHVALRAEEPFGGGIMPLALAVPVLTGCLAAVLLAFTSWAPW